MEDPVSVTFRTFDKLAAAQLHDPRLPESYRDREVIEHFVLRTGRPLPKVVVLGRNLGAHCKQIDELGGSAIGVDGGANVIEFAKRQYPDGHFEQGDIRDLPVDKNAYDGAWTASVLEHIPRDEVPKALQSVHDVLRPGGLLYTLVPVGDEEGFEETEAGPIYRVKWNPDHLAEVLAAMNFDLLETREFSPEEVGMIYRREY